MKCYKKSRTIVDTPDSFAAALSVVPGLGHIYKGHYFQGVCILVGDALIAMGVGTLISLAYVGACIFRGIHISISEAIGVLLSSPMIIAFIVLPLLLYWVWAAWDAFYEPDLRQQQKL